MTVLSGPDGEHVCGPAPGVGAIIRRGEFVAPRGETVVEPGDHVALFLAADVLPGVTAAV